MALNAAAPRLILRNSIRSLRFSESASLKGSATVRASSMSVPARATSARALRRQPRKLQLQAGKLPVWAWGYARSHGKDP